MRKVLDFAPQSNRNRYSSPSSTLSSLELETSLLTISGWEEGGHFSFNGEDGDAMGSQNFVDDSYEA